MYQIFCRALLLAVPGTALATETSFQDVLQNVEQREPRTGAIVRVRSSSSARAAGKPAVYANFEMRIKGKTVQVEMFRNYLTGKEGESFTFPVGPEVEAEYARLQNLAQLRKFDAAVADAERRRRIFVLSSFKLKAGSDRDAVERALGKPTSETSWMRAGWHTLVFPEVTVVMTGASNHRMVHDIRSKPRRQ